MPVQISEYVDIESRAKKLVTRVPTLIALLPANFATARSKRDLYYDKHAQVLREQIAAAGYTETPFEKNGDVFKVPAQDDMLGHAKLGLFLGTPFFEGKPLAPMAVWDLLNAAFADIVRRAPDFTKVTLEVVVQRPQARSYGLVKYSGSLLGLDSSDLQRAVQQVSAGIA
ncbi:MAG: hypothetical protein JSU73_06365 [candidate division WOR-3 bacterium]|nr:MAG: hypothetical protein JSU73_06365 [candidate division WOR-3 bacterium]